MSVIDKSIYTLTCPACHAHQEKAILDKGSTFGGSYWQSSVTFELFTTAWQGGGHEEPKLVSASCKTCKIAPNISTRYGL
jgi:hypothetical protein